MIILAIDPGRDKCGYAVLNKLKSGSSFDNEENNWVCEKGITVTPNLRSYLEELLNKYNIGVFVLGDGTNSEKIKDLLLDNFELPVIIVNEAYTTYEAEKLYRREKLKGWKRIFSFIKWKPSKPIDDYAAVILGQRFLKENN